MLLLSRLALIILPAKGLNLSSKHMTEDTGREIMREKYDIPARAKGWREAHTSSGLSASHAPILNLPERPGPEFPFSTRPAGTALLLLLLKERWVKRPACEEQEGRRNLKKVKSRLLGSCAESCNLFGNMSSRVQTENKAKEDNDLNF